MRSTLISWRVTHPCDPPALNSSQIHLVLCSDLFDPQVKFWFILVPFLCRFVDTVTRQIKCPFSKIQYFYEIFFDFVHILGEQIPGSQVFFPHVKSIIRPFRRRISSKNQFFNVLVLVKKWYLTRKISIFSKFFKLNFLTFRIRFKNLRSYIFHCSERDLDPFWVI